MHALPFRFVSSFVAFVAVAWVASFTSAQPATTEQAAAAAPSAADLALAAELGEEIRTGTANSGASSVDFGTAVGVVEASSDRVMEIIHDYARYAEFMPHFQTSRVLSRRGTSAMVYMEVGIMRDSVTLWAQLRIRDRRQAGPSRVVEARMMQGNMDNFVARWKVTPLSENRSLVEFRLLVDPDLPIPASLATRENVKAARRSISALRTRL